MVVNLIKENNEFCQVNTFGVGSHVDTSLIKNCAKAGRGHYTFIEDGQNIERKVIEALTKDFIELLEVQHIRVYDD
jgi:hydrogenase maturation factor